MLSLKDVHELKERKLDVSVLQESIDQATVNEIEKALSSLEHILKAPELKSLESLHFGFQKASEDLSNILAYGNIKKWAHSLLPKGFTTLGRVSGFTTGVTRLFQQLPQLVNIIQRRMGLNRPAEWDSTKPIHDMLDDATLEKLHDIIKRSMNPPAGLSFLSKGLPYVNDDQAAAEILELSFDDLTNLSSRAKEAALGKTRISAKNIAAGVKAVITQQQKNVSPVTSVQTPAPAIKQQEQEQEKLQIPTKDLVLPSHKSTKNQKQELPLASTFVYEIDDVFRETIKSLGGQKWEHSRQFKEFKPAFLRAVLKRLVSTEVCIDDVTDDGQKIAKDKKLIRKPMRPL